MMHFNGFKAAAKAKVASELFLSPLTPSASLASHTQLMNTCLVRDWCASPKEATPGN